MNAATDIGAAPMDLPNFVCCPECHAGLSRTDKFVKCEQCHQEYPVAASAQIDLRPRRRFVKTASFAVDPVDPIWSVPRQGHPSSSPHLKNMAVSTLDQIIPKAGEAGAIALEIGCGARRDVRGVIEGAGFAWIGVDWYEKSAPFLADIHALPFRDNSFPLVASDAVLEHVRYPHIAILEMARVLRPGGVMIGEVAFLQPYHTSYFHMTHEAVIDLTRYAGLELTMYGRGSTAALGYLAKGALGRLAWTAWPADSAFKGIAKWRQAAGDGGDMEVYFACTVLFSAKKPLR